MAKSILSNEKRCYVCGNTYEIEKHHIYGGGNRQVSEANGFWVYLCKRHHTRTVYSVHGDPEHKLDKELKRICQLQFERTNTHQRFMALIGKSYTGIDYE